MKNKIVTVLLAVILLMPATVPVSAASDDAAAEAFNILDYFTNEAGSSNYVEYMHNCLIPEAGNGTEWNVISMTAMEINADYEKYNEALDSFLESSGKLKATDYERIALAKAVTGHNDGTVENAVKEYTESNTIMSYIYGLMVSDCIDSSLGGQIAGELISMQKEDGGFSLMGDYSDPDVTAMALQALAPYVGTYEEQIDKAVLCLSKMQRESGGYSSCGVENVESSAQVLIALCALNIDYKSDERFIKNSNTVFDAILTYKCDDGGFSHTPDGGTNKLATTQTLLAFACAARYDEGKTFVFSSDFCINAAADDERGTEPESEEETGCEAEKSEETVSGDIGDFRNHITGRTIKLLILSVIALTGLICVSVEIKNKSGKKKTILTACVTLALLAAAGTLKVESVGEHYAHKYSYGDVHTSIGIEGADNIIILDMEIYIDDGDSAFTQLKKAVQAEKINIDYTGSEALGTIYVRSIDGLSEFDYGSMSGWTYTVNGEYPDVSCSSIRLKDGDEVRWIYQMKNSE